MIRSERRFQSIHSERNSLDIPIKQHFKQQSIIKNDTHVESYWLQEQSLEERALQTSSQKSIKRKFHHVNTKSVNLGSKAFGHFFHSSKPFDKMQINENSQLLKFAEITLPTQESVLPQEDLQIQENSVWNSRFDPSGYIEIDLFKPSDFEHTNWFNLVHKTNMNRKVRVRDEMSPQL